MGMLTPLIIRNDDLERIKNDPEMIEKIVEACSDRAPSTIGTNYWKPRKWWQIWKPKLTKTVGGCCNAIEVMGYKHADEPRILFVCGNTMSEINPYMEFDELSEFMLDYYEKSARHVKRDMETTLRQIAEVKKHLRDREDGR